MIELDAISIVLDQKAELVVTIAAAHLSDPLQSVTALPTLPDGILGLLAPTGERGAITYDPEARIKGRQPLSLREVRRYSFTLYHTGKKNGRDASQFDVSSSLTNGRNSKWTLRKIKGVLSGEIQVINYIGTAWLEVGGFARIKFEITPEKINYEVEYRSMVEAIAKQCQQLLLEWNTPTTLSFTPNPSEEKRTLLEQFLFLRHCLGSDRLDLYLEILNRNPHRGLLREDRWGSEGDPRFFEDPIRYGRDWTDASCGPSAYFGGLLPQEINRLHKRETLDTAPNRFVKYALCQFRDLCQRVLDHPQIEGAAHDEALAMEETLDAFLAQRWLWEVGELDQIPLNNQTLLHREGYRQILEAWFLSDVAAQLDWEGREDAYDGNNRDVATLYEYWLYFELLDLLTEEIGCERVEANKPEPGDEALPFIVQVEGKGLRVNLKQGRASYSSFRFTTEEGITNRINLYYNRSFTQRPVLESGTYSRPLRPDYSLVIFPEAIAVKHKKPKSAEAEAARTGQIAYLHFDAKYRVETITDIFGEGTKDEIDEERREEKVTKTYKRGDLYKMHTYNEAIRRTVGSYVLYPGTDHNVNSGFEKFHELLPGVGAFALRPTVKDGNPSAEGREGLASFLRDVVLHQADRMSQLFRIQQSTHRVVKEAPREVTVGDKQVVIANPDTSVVLGYMRPEKAPDFRSKRLFYCRTTNAQGAPVKLDLAISEGSLLVGYTGAHQHRTSVDWYAEIVSCQVVTAAQLQQRTGFQPSQEETHYLLFLLGKPWHLPPRDLAGISPPGGGRTVQKVWIDIAEAPEVPH